MIVRCGESTLRGSVFETAFLLFTFLVLPPFSNQSARTEKPPQPFVVAQHASLDLTARVTYYTFGTWQTGEIDRLPTNWWRSFWAYVGYAALAGVLLYALHRRQLNRMRSILEGQHHQELEHLKHKLGASVAPETPVSIHSERSAQLRTTHPGTTPLVLIIDGDPAVRAELTGNLVPCRCDGASSGLEGIEQAKKLHPDLIIANMILPEMGGFELCTRIKTDDATSHIPVILLTTASGIEHQPEGMQFGADDYVTRPFDGVSLLIRLRNLILVRHSLWKRFGHEVPQRTDVAVTSVDNQFLQRALSVVEERMHEESLSVEDVAHDLGMSRSQLHRRLTFLTNHPPNEFIRYMRLHRAKYLLEQNVGNVSEVAYRVGFNSVAYFTKCFREQFSVVPSELRRG